MSDLIYSSMTIAVSKPLWYPSTNGSDEHSDSLFNEHYGKQTGVIPIDERK